MIKPLHDWRSVLHHLDALTQSKDSLMGVARLSALVTVAVKEEGSAIPASVAERQNYRGRRVHLRGGLGTAAGTLMAGMTCAAIPPVSRLATATSLLRFLHRRPLTSVAACDGSVSYTSLGLATAVASSMSGTAGLIDDLEEPHRDAEFHAKGLSGHFMALRSGHVTTGMMKVGLIGAAAVLAGAILSADAASTISASAPVSNARGQRASWRIVERGIDVGFRALTIASWANVANLLDLRPGRCLKAMSMMAGPAMVSDGWLISASQAGGRSLSPVVLRPRPGARRALATGILSVCAMSAGSDLDETTMLGDTGANALGAAVGVLLASSPSQWVRACAAVAGLGLTVVSERVSFSAVIDSNPVLCAWDRYGRSDLTD